MCDTMKRLIIKYWYVPIVVVALLMLSLIVLITIQSAFQRITLWFLFIALITGVDIVSFICGYDFVDSCSFAFDKNRYYQGCPNPRLEKLRQGKCQVDSE